MLYLLDHLSDLLSMTGRSAKEVANACKARSWAPGSRLPSKRLGFDARGSAYSNNSGGAVRNTDSSPGSRSRTRSLARAGFPAHLRVSPLQVRFDTIEEVTRSPTAISAFEELRLAEEHSSEVEIC